MGWLLLRRGGQPSHQNRQRSSRSVRQASAQLALSPADRSMQWRVLGPVEAVVEGRLVDLGPPMQRAVFALLLSRVGWPVPVDVLLEELWSGDPPPAAMTSLRAYVLNLRRVLEPKRAPRAPATVLRTRAPGYLLDGRSVDLDVERFTRHATAGREAWGRDDAQAALTEFETGLALWRGQPYADVVDAAWVAPEVARLEELRLSVIEGRCAALLAVGAHEVAVAELGAHVHAHPLREHGCELLALALYRGGRQADALAVLRVTRGRLADELGINPGTALQRLERDILTQASALDWHPPRSVATALARAPAQGPTSTAVLELVDDEVFIGRESALQRLLDVLAAVARERGQLVLVAGEPGIGKTHLLQRFSKLASAPVVWGRCPEHIAAPPLWPWEQVLRAVHANWPDRPVPDSVAALLSGEPLEMSQLDVAGAALRRFEAIGEYLTTGTDSLVIVLDDLHQADMASLQLLRHLTGLLATSRLLLVATYRPHEAEPLADTLARLVSVGAARIELVGLDREETHVLANAIVGRKVSKHIAEGLWARTEGNPFFVRELVGLLVSEQRLDQPDTAPVPVPVREVVLRRIARLPESTAAVLSVAAVAGWDFDAQVVAEAASIEIERAMEALDTAVAAGLVVEDEQRLGWFHFTHVLVAETLYQATGRLRRVRLHRRIGQAAARAWTGQDERIGEIARHWLLAAELDPATAAQAATYAAAAAQVADARLAPQDAAELWQHALASADLAGNDVDRHPLLIGLATSLFRAARPFDELPMFVQAMEQTLAKAGSEGINSSRLITAVVEDMERVLGPRHRHTLLIRYYLARWTGEAGDAAGARELAVALVEDDEQILGTEHRHTLLARAQLVRWTGEAGDAAGARTQATTLLKDLERIYGPNHQNTRATRTDLAQWTTN